MRFGTVGLTVLLTAASLFSAKAAQAQMVGFESEFATVGFLSPTWGDAQLQLSKKLLEIVRTSFGGSGEIKLVPWAKYPEKNLQNYIYVDPTGRTWKMEPESVNSGSLDGIEFVTPPLSTNEDFKNYISILSEIKKTKTVMRGLRSSGHLTVDVSHLLLNLNDVSDLVDKILTIENHWADTYRFFDPIRYGTKINRFSVPLAVDQQDLLRELAALPRTLRTYANVRSLFLKYDQREGQLRDPDQKNPTRKWKYRAANYGKLFALHAGDSPIYAIEFRLDDLNFGAKVKDNVFFLRNLVTSQLVDRIFRAPFGNQPLRFDQANERLSKMPIDAEFLQDKVTSKKLQIIAARKSAAAPEPDLSDMTQPVGVDDDVISFGFEAEFKGERGAKLLTGSDEGGANIKAYPYLDSNTSVEPDSDNTEVRSVGGEHIFTEVVDQMTEVRSILKNDLKGFHVHMRVPAKLIAKHNQDDLRAWLSMTSDAVFAWRLQNRPHFFALKTWSLARQSTERIEERGPLRMRVLEDGTWDIEIRGYMTSIEMIGMMTQKIVTGLVRPDYIRTTVEEREFFLNEKLNLTDSINRWAKTHVGRDLTDKEKSSLQDLGKDIKGIGLMPLYDFAKIPGLEATQRRKILNSTNLFFKETFTVLQNIDSGKYKDYAEGSKQFRWRVKRWAQAIDLQSLLEKQILRTDLSDTSNRFERMNEARRQSLIEKIDVALADPNSENIFPKDQTPKQLLKDPRYSDLLLRALKSSNREHRVSALSQASGQSDLRFLPIFKEASKDQDARIRDQAIYASRSQKPEDQISILEHSSNDSEKSVRITVAESASRILILKPARVIIARLLNDPDESVRDRALRSVIANGSSESSETLLNAFGKQQMKSSASLIMSLGRLTDIQSLQALKTLVASTVEETKTTALAALALRKENEAVQIIVSHLKDESFNVRYSAVLAITDKFDPAIETALVEMMQDRKQEVRLQAILALSKFPTLRPNPIYKELIQDSMDFIHIIALKIFLSQQDSPNFRSYYAAEINGVHLNDAQKTILKLEYNKRFGSFTRKLPNLNCQAAFR